MTYGNSTSVKCPGCKQMILDPLEGLYPRSSEIVELVRRCPRCNVPLHLWGRLTVVVDCELEKKVK